MLKDVLERQGEIGVQLLRESFAPFSVSGETVDSIRYEATETRLQMFMREFVETLETGRGPRKDSAEGGFRNNLERWLDLKGFQKRVSKSGTTYYKIGPNWFSAKSLAWKINKQGDKQFRKGSPRDVYTSVMEKFQEDTKNAIVAYQLNVALGSVKDSLKGIK